MVKVSQLTAWQILGKIVTASSTLIILSLVSRSYGESGTGLFTLVLAYLNFFYLGSEFGLNTHILTTLNSANISNTFKNLLGLRLVWSAILTLFSLFLLPFLPFANTSFSYSVFLGCLTIILFSIFTTISIIFQSRLKLEYTVLSTIISTLFSFSLIFILIYFRVEIYWLLIAHLVGWTVADITSMYFLKKIISSISPIFSLNFAKEIFIKAWPISLSLVLNVIYFRFDAFILTTFRSFTDVGIYNLSYQVFQSALVIPSFIMNSLYPMMIKDISFGKRVFISNLKRAAIAMLSIALAGSVITYLLSPMVVSIITGGKGFLGSVDSLRILSLGFPAYFLSSLFMFTLVTLKEYKKLAVVYLLGLGVNITLNLIFIPSYSYIAASWVTGISEYLILVMQLIILLPLTKKR